MEPKMQAGVSAVTQAPWWLRLPSKRHLGTVSLSHIDAQGLWIQVPLFIFKEFYMNKSLALAFVAFAGVAGAASAESALPTATPKAIQVAALRTEQPVMSYEVAALMQTLHKAQAQHRRSGKPQDLARVEATRRELASRGYGRATQTAPVMMAQSGSTQDAATGVRVSLAD